MQSAQPAVTILTPMSAAPSENGTQSSWAYLFNTISPGVSSRLKFLGAFYLMIGLVAIGCEAYLLKNSGDRGSSIEQALLDFPGSHLLAFGIIVLLICNCQIFVLTGIFILGFYQLINLAKNAAYFSVTVAIMVERCSESSSSTCTDSSIKTAFIVLLVCAIIGFFLVADNLMVIARECRLVSSYAARIQPLPVAYVNQLHNATTA